MKIRKTDQQDEPQTQRMTQTQAIIKTWETACAMYQRLGEQMHYLTRQYTAMGEVLKQMGFLVAPLMTGEVRLEPEKTLTVEMRTYEEAGSDGCPCDGHNGKT